MAGETSETDLKTFRDFLMQYNSVTEQCFTSCVQDLTKREVTEKEERCAKNCLDKFLKMTQRLSMRFQEHQLLNTEAQGGVMANKSLMLLCEAVLEDHFGYYVKCVAHELLNSELSLIELRKALKGVCKTTDICRAIAIMDLHDLMKYGVKDRRVVYEILAEHVLRFIYIPRAINVVKQLYDSDLHAKIMSELAFYGRASYEKCVSSLVSTFSEKNCLQAFSDLTHDQIIRKRDVVVSDETGLPITQEDPQPFAFNIPLKLSTEKIGSRKRKHEDTVDRNLWCLNWSRIDRYLHNEMILNVVRNHKDYNPADENVWRSLLLVADSRLNSPTQPQSDPISVQEVCRYVKEHYKMAIMSDKVNAIFSKLDSSSDFSQMNLPIIRKSGESSGGLYTINYVGAVEMFCNDHVESVLRQRIDDHAVRIFRLLRMKHNIEEELLTKMAMLSPKEVKEICYLMLEDGYIFSRAIPRTNDFAPSRSLYFYSYKFADLVSNMTVLCCDSLRNTIRRRLHEVEANKILLDVRQKIDQIVSTIKEKAELSEEAKNAQAEEVEENYMTEQDQRNYQRHVLNQRRLRATEISISQALFVFQLGRLFNNQSSLFEAEQKKKRKKPTLEL